MTEPIIVPVAATIPSSDDAPATFAKAQALLDTLGLGAQAGALGWAHHPDGTDQCPNCEEQP